MRARNRPCSSLMQNKAGSTADSETRAHSEELVITRYTKRVEHRVSRTLVSRASAAALAQVP